jgi:acyl dehydratase
MTRTSPELLTVGNRLPPFTRHAGFHNWNRYAAVNSEFVDIHMDDEAGRAAGYSGAIGMGNLTFSWLYCMLREWLGDAGHIVRVQCQFRGPALKDDIITCHGVITRTYTEEGTPMAELEIWSENQRNQRTTPGTATVAFISSGR